MTELRETQILDLFGLRSHRDTQDMTVEHECMNWQNLGMSNDDNKQDWADNEK